MNATSEGVKGRIILMDDDESIREIAYEIISALGYEIDCTKDGNELIDLYKEAVAKNIHIDAVILDLTVPGGMGGKEAIQKLREIDPNVFGIVSSGYSNDPIMSVYQDFGFKAVIVKPYRIEEMEEVLANAIK
jgi:two-component system, cell cycle sensor histidine kinase and response regulator CckA